MTIIKRRGVITNGPLNSNGGWNVTSSLSFTNMPLLQYSSEIRSAVLMIHGEKAPLLLFQQGCVYKAHRR
jgi:hypothetical protein